MPRAIQLSPKVAAAKRNGRLGGLARARKLSAIRRQKISAMGGTKTFRMNGRDFYRAIGLKRKRVGRYRTPVNAQKVKV